MLTLLLTAILDPRVASFVGAALAGHPDYGAQLERICTREAPHCRLRGVHEGDRWMERTLGEGNGTRGAWGTVAAFTVDHLPLGLRAAWWLDVPLLGAIAATRRAHAPACRLVRGCRRWGWA